MPRSRALITGISGFVGSHLAEFLLAETDWEIYGMLRVRSPLDNLQGVLRNRRMHYGYADLNDEISLRGVVRQARPDYVFHLAAQSYPLTSFTAPVDTLSTNVNGTARLLEVLKELAREAHIHVCSSSEVYGRVPKECVPINEDCRFHPASPYAISKAGADLLGQHYAQAYGMNVQVTRMFTHTGPRRGDVFAESSFAKQVAMIEARQIEPVVKHGNLESLRTIADVRDAVRAYYLLLTVNPVRGAVYNIGGITTKTVGDIMRDIVRESPHHIRIFFEPDVARLRPLDADLQVPDCLKFREHTGWQPTIPYQKTISDLVQYWRERVKVSSHLDR
jgi:GDPmannose 4,6-dehydratase